MSESESEIDESTTHAASLKRLKTKDPDFYEFLKENDKELLEFEASDNEEDENDQQEDDDGDEIPSQSAISAPKLEYIKQQISSAPTIKLCKHLISAFKSAVHQADGFAQKKVDMGNSELFNNIIKLCLIELVPALYKVLKLSTDDGKRKVDPTKSKLWKKLQMSIKSYLTDMLKLLNVMNDSSVLTLLLKHAVHLIPFYSAFIKLSRQMVKKMITFWSSEEETVRVLSLIVIVRSTKTLPKEYLSQVLKSMYFSYIKNTKFTSPTTWPMINFMKRSLTEVYSLNPEIAYEHAFIYIRQLSIHLRNAITTKKKENMQTVYNWQYVHCILHWVHLLCRLKDHDAIKSLIYPLVQTTIGVINLIPTARYVPLRFHLIKGLMHISETTNTFVPALPLILDVLNVSDYNKKSTFSVKPIDFSCSLKIAKSQLSVAGFKDACISEVCNLLLQYFKIYSNSIGFPELSLPAVLQIKSFAKQCKISKYNQQLKAVLVKIEENATFICEKRHSVTFEINNNEEIKKWEEDVKEKGIPLLKVKEKESPAVSMPPKKKKRTK